MESKKLEALMMSVDPGSFTRTAEVLGHTQSGLAHGMDSLEKTIGVPLLEWGRSGVRLMPKDERVAPAIRDFLDSASRLDAALTQVGDVRREAIWVGTYASMGVHWLPGIIRRFREECPEASVEMQAANHIAEAYTALLQGKLDLIFASRQEPGDYQWISLWQDPMFAAFRRRFSDCAHRVGREMTGKMMQMPLTFPPHLRYNNILLSRVLPGSSPKGKGSLYAAMEKREPGGSPGPAPIL